MTTAKEQDALDGAGRRVAVIGGGPAGLTVAHELAERGFTVDVYERNDTLGGKCRSLAYQGTGTDGRPDLPQNMGGHFFFGFYRNIGETLRRIPVGNDRTVLDNLTTGPANRMSIRFFWAGNGLTVDVASHSGLRGLLAGGVLTNVKTTLRVVGQLGLRDSALLASKIALACTAGENRRREQFEHHTLREMFQANSFTTQVARRFAGEIASNLTIANGEDENARVAAKVFEGAVASALGRNGRGMTGLLAHLNNPEGEAWIDPWVRHLEGLAVRFHLQKTTDRLVYDGSRIVAATVRDKTGAEHSVEADWFVVAVPSTEMASLMSADLVAADPALGRVQHLRRLGGVSVTIYLRHKVPELGSAFVIGDGNWQNGNEVLTSVWQKDLSQYGDGEAVEVISAQITDPAFRYQAGRLYGKTGDSCTPTEFVDEMLAMFRTHIPDGERLFAEEAIHSWVIEDEERSSGDAPLETIDEYLFAPTRSCWQNQPDQRTAIPNLFLAGTHTRTVLGCDSMDGANESGKLAANAVLEAAGSAARAEVLAWSAHPVFRPFQWWDDRRFAAGKRNIFDFIAPMTADVESINPVDRWNARLAPGARR